MRKTHTRTHARTHTPTHTRTHARTHTHTHTHTHAHTHMHARTHAYMRACTHRHTELLAESYLDISSNYIMNYILCYLIKVQFADVCECLSIILHIVQLYLQVPIMLMMFLRQEHSMAVVAGRSAHPDCRLDIKVNLSVFRLTTQ